MSIGSPINCSFIFSLFLDVISKKLASSSNIEFLKLKFPVITVSLNIAFPKNFTYLKSRSQLNSLSEKTEIFSKSVRS